jgi:S1-C subfamily serine protease
VQITPAEGSADLVLDGHRLGDEIRQGLGDLGAFAYRMPSFDFDFQLPGSPSRARLGVTVQELSPQLAAYFGAKDGVLVSSVADDSAASKAGIKAGDVITGVNGDAVRTAEDLTRTLRRLDDGQATIRLVREKKDITVTATLGRPRRALRGRPAA